MVSVNVFREKERIVGWSKVFREIGEGKFKSIFGYLIIRVLSKVYD